MINEQTSRVAVPEPTHRTLNLILIGTFHGSRKIQPALFTRANLDAVLQDPTVGDTGGEDSVVRTDVPLHTRIEEFTDLRIDVYGKEEERLDFACRVTSNHLRMVQDQLRSQLCHESHRGPVFDAVGEIRVRPIEGPAKSRQFRHYPIETNGESVGVLVLQVCVVLLIPSASERETNLRRTIRMIGIHT